MRVLRAPSASRRCSRGRHSAIEQSSRAGIPIHVPTRRGLCPEKTDTEGNRSWLKRDWMRYLCLRYTLLMGQRTEPGPKLLAREEFTEAAANSVLCFSGQVNDYSP